MVEIVQPEQRVQGREFHQTVDVASTPAAPSYGLFQPYFPLTEADYLRMKAPQSVLYGAAAGILAFGVTYLLSPLTALVVSWIWPGSPTPSTTNLIMGAGILLVGLLVLWAAHSRSSERRTVMENIKQHFEENPGENAIRLGNG